MQRKTPEECRRHVHRRDVEDPLCAGSEGNREWVSCIYTMRIMEQKLLRADTLFSACDRILSYMSHDTVFMLYLICTAYGILDIHTTSSHSNKQQPSRRTMVAPVQSNNKMRAYSTIEPALGGVGGCSGNVPPIQPCSYQEYRECHTEVLRS
ncbi:hypothetical protein BX600DRAFT_119077 [Xylariales sp. PMI_506]|nr:hypothetical protein BX600DRAFT_119077 [Xylariales sp. PMI_506]